jgi:hypothetical protein
MCVNAADSDDLSGLIGCEHFFSGSPVEPDEELWGTDQQEKIIAATLALTDRLLIRHRLTPARLDRSRVHLISQETCDRIAPGSGGFVSRGHACVAITPDMDCSIFVGRLTHEVCHVAGCSIKLIDVSDPAAPKECGYIFGLSATASILCGLPIRPFVGLNEAVTEYAAHQLRLELIKLEIMPPITHPSLRRYWRQGTDYGHFVEFILLLLGDASPDDGQATKRLVRDMLTGGQFLHQDVQPARCHDTFGRSHQHKRVHAQIHAELRGSLKALHALGAFFVRPLPTQPGCDVLF